MHPANQPARQAGTQAVKQSVRLCRADRYEFRQTESQTNRKSDKQSVSQTQSQTDRNSYKQKVVQHSNFWAFGAFKWNYDNGLTSDLETAKIFDV